MVILGFAPAAAPLLILLSPQPIVEDAAALYARGAFEEARHAVSARLAASPGDLAAVQLSAELALLANDLDGTVAAIHRASQGHEPDRRALEILGEARYRRDEFAGAAAALRRAGKSAMASKLESFAGERPNAIEGPDATELPFLATDPLPVVEIAVDDGDPLNVLIDTGGSELILSPEVAKRLEAPTFGKESSTFAGGLTASYEHARIDRVELGGITVRNVPVRLLDTRRFAAVAPGRTIDGVLGTVPLYHFTATLDYPGGRLVLRRRGSPAPTRASGATPIEVPFWLASDHLMVANGTVNGGPQQLWFVDTGLAGGGFTAPAGTLAAAGIAVTGPAQEGIGGGGRTSVTPITVRELTLGAARRTGVPGFFGPFPPSLEQGLGFRIGGLVSHAFLRTWRVTFDFDRMRIVLE